MDVKTLALPGLILLTPRRFSDARGYFEETYNEATFRAAGISTHFVQDNQSYSAVPGTIRGLHFQAEPHPEIKTVRCMRGAIYDVAVDVRPSSPTFGRWEAFELSASNNKVLYIGAGFAHGFQVLEPDSEVLYQMSESYYPELSRGVRYDDPAMGIRWPLAVTMVSERDRNLTLLCAMK